MTIALPHLLRRLLPLLVMGALLCVVPAAAVDNTKAAAALATSAREAYQAGQHERAADLFMQAWQAALSETGLLYNAARASHQAGQLREAETRYRQFLALPTHDKAVDTKVAGYLHEIRVHFEQEQAAAKAREAHAEAARKLAQQQPQTVPPPTVRKAAPDRTPGIAMTAVGVAAAVTAGILAWHFADAQQTLNKQTSTFDQDHLIATITWKDANAARDSIGRYKTGAAVTGGVAVAALGAGVWWLVAPESWPFAVTPSPSGVSLSGSF